MHEQCATIAAEPAEIRQETRFHCLTTGVLLHIAGSQGTHEAQVTEISRSGLRLEVDVALPAGSSVQFDLGPMVITGEVRYCSPGPKNSFMAGVSITDVRKV